MSDVYARDLPGDYLVGMLEEAAKLRLRKARNHGVEVYDVLSPCLSYARAMNLSRSEALMFLAGLLERGE